ASASRPIPMTRRRPRCSSATPTSRSTKRSGAGGTRSCATPSRSRSTRGSRATSSPPTRSRRSRRREAAGRTDRSPGRVVSAPLAYVVAKAKDPSIELIATNIEEGSSTYSGYILVRGDSPIVTAADFKQKRFGFVDVESTSGFLYAYAFFLEQGILPERDFKV